MMNDINHNLTETVRLSAHYCSALENCRDYERDEFVKLMTDLLPRIYWDFANIEMEEESDMFDASEFMDEDYYESIRRGVEAVMGEDDMFLETFEEDMKYSDTPIAVSVAESLSDIFQPLYNFVSAVKESDGVYLQSSFAACRERFCSYWGQTLCNVLRALNHLRFNS